MADTGKQSPLGVNVLGSILNNTGLNINPVAASYMGASKTNSSYSFGSLVQNTVLRLLTWSINDGYLRGPGNSNTTLTNTTYNNLITIGTGTIPGLGNTIPPTYLPEDPAGVWTTTAVAYGTQQGVASLPGPATSGYPITGNTGQGQQATWYPWNTSNPNVSVTQWGWIRCHALQAWNTFNWNGSSVTLSNPEYKEFCSSFLTASAWVNYSNQAILAVKDSETFLEGVYSNMSDLISGDIAGVNLSSINFGTDLVNLGKAVNLRTIASFGLPSNLLQTLGLNNAITQDLSLALLAAGLTNSEISQITTGANIPISKTKEQQIYGAFLIITGENLRNVLAPLQCNTQGFTSLADLLNIRKMFPNSYQSMTVPVYNTERGLPTNSKTYYLIYTSGSVNGALDTPSMREFIGPQVPPGPPITTDTVTAVNNYREVPAGFGSYLRDIIPQDQAVAAGAFSYSMRQIRNIEFCDFEKFAKAVKGMENVVNLPLTAGTDKPTNQEATDFSMQVCALGSGPYGSYTLSDMFGCMSGLPYPWKLTYDRIRQLTTTKLSNIYQQLFLAVTWEKANCTIVTNPTYINQQQYRAPGTLDPSDPGQPRIDDLYYTVTITAGDNGGGYGRGTAPNPVVTLSPNNCGASVTTDVGRDDRYAASNGNGEFGRVTFTINNGGSYMYGTATNSANNNPPDQSPGGADAPPIESISVQAPPTAALPVTASGAVATGGTNTTGDTYYSVGSPTLGTAGWQSPMNSVVQGYIDQANAEIIVIQQNNPDPAVHLNTYWNLMGTNLKKEHRARYNALIPVTVPKDLFLNTYPMSHYTFVDSIPTLAQDTRPHMAAQTIEAITNMNTVGGQSAVGMMRQERNQTRLQELGIQLDNNMPDGLSPAELKTLTTNGTLPGAVDGIPSPNGEEYTAPPWAGNDDGGNVTTPIPIGIYTPSPDGVTGDGFRPGTGTAPGDITPIITGDPNPVVLIIISTGPVVEPDVTDPVVIKPPTELDPTNLPPNLDPNYTGSTLMPASPNIEQAIEKVIECNCDCWVN